MRPDADQREQLAAALAEAGWRLNEDRLVIGQRVIPPVPSEDPKREQGSPTSDRTASIFLVHGHDRLRLAEVARFIERVTDRQVAILHEQPNSGRTLIEKFEHNAASAAHAVVLLTADDIGRAKATDPSQERPRGRQNVVLELGFFFGKLGREHVTVLKDPQVEDPSDIHGLVYTPLDHEWKLALARELEASGSLGRPG